MFENEDCVPKRAAGAREVFLNNRYPFESVMTELHELEQESSPGVMTFWLEVQVYKFKFDPQPGSLTDQVAGEHQPSYVYITSISFEIKR